MASSSDSVQRSASRTLDENTNGEPTRLRRRERDATRGADRMTDIGSMIKVTKSDMAEEVQSAEANTKRLEKANKRLTEELRGALERAEKLEDEMRRRDRANSEAASKMDESAKKAKYESDREIRELTSKLEAASAKLDDLKSDFEEKSDKSSAEYEKRIATLTSDVSDLKKKMREETEDPRIATLEEKLKSEKDERNKMDGEVRKLEGKVRDLERASESKDRTIAELKSDLEDKNKELSEFASEKDSQNKEVRQLRKDAAEAEDLRKQASKLQDQLDAAQKELKDANRKVDDLESEKRRLEREVSRSGGSSSTSPIPATVETMTPLPAITTSTYTSGRYSRSAASTPRDGATERVGRDRERETSSASNTPRGRESSRTRDSSSTRESSLTRRSSRASNDDASSSSSADSSALKAQVSRLEREQERKISDMEEKVREAELEQKKVQSLYEKEKMQREDLEKALKQDRVEGKQQVDLAIEQVGLTTKQLAEAQAEISKLQKAIQKKDRDLDDLKLKYDELLNNFTSTKNTLSKTDTQGKSTERSLQTTERKLRDAETVRDKTNDKLVSTTEELRATKQSLDEARAELAAALKHFDASVKVLEEELYEETVMKEKLLKAKAELEKELQVLRWYFKPLANQTAPEDKENQTNEFNFAEIKRKEVENELATLFKGQTAAKKSKSIAELQVDLKEGLAKLSENIREDLSYELEDLMKYMTLAGMKTKTKLSIFVTLVLNAVDAGIVRELANITSDLAEGKLHVMNSPETVIKFATKEAERTPDNPRALSESLLNRLALIRSKKTGKDFAKCKIIILEGGEYDD